MREYEYECSGFVVASSMEGPRGTITSYWYGPDRMWGTTWGPLGRSVAVFASRPAARKAFETVRAWGPGNHVARVADVEAALRARGRAWVPTMVHRPTDKPILWEWASPDRDTRTPEGVAAFRERLGL